jgi:hypothetical protein
VWDPRQHARTDLFVIVEAEYEVGPAGRSRVLWELDERLSSHPMRSRAAYTRRAFAAPQLLTLRER